MADPMTIRGQVRPDNAFGLTGEQIIRLGRGGDLLVNILPPMYWATKAGRVYHASTPDGGVAPGTDITSTTAPVCLYNPIGSGVDLVVVNARVAYVSGTLGAGDIYWVANVNSAAAAVTGTALTVVRGYIEATGGAIGRPFHTATLPAAGTLMRVFGSIDATLASTVGMGTYVLEDNPEGTIVVPPGTSVSLLADAAAGATPLLAYSFTWIEVPV